jgi:deoxyadenosine/deoxycytidine kinase
MTKKKKLHVAIAGNIGVGKTILTRILSEKLGWHAFYEKVLENPFLEKFYDNMPLYSFQVQIFFLTQRLKIQNEIKLWPGSCLQDRTIQEDADVFVPTLYKLGFLTQADFNTYNDLYTMVAPMFHTPDLILFLKAPVEQLVHNILKRDRIFEQTIDPSYLEELNLAYDNWYKNERDKGKRFMLVDASLLDFERDSQHLKKIIGTINDLENQVWAEIV